MERVSKEEMERIKAANRHKEIMSSFEQTINKLNDYNTNLNSVLQSNNRIISTLKDKLSELSKPVTVESPNVTVETNQDKVVSAIQVLTAQISANNVPHEAEPKKWDFEVIRDNFGRLISVRAKEIT